MARSPKRKVALVVGVSRYDHFPTLANPGRDAEAVARSLGNTGFDVDLVPDPDRDTLIHAIERLSAGAAQFGPGSAALFYFAGHGLQWSSRNYLIPKNGRIKSAADLERQAVQADFVLNQFGDGRGATKILVLDACRNVPDRFDPDSAPGLAYVLAPNDSYIAYSTAPGMTAADGRGQTSPFATAFVSELERPDQSIEGVFRNVRRSVIRETRGAQTPWDSSSLTSAFAFGG